MRSVFIQQIYETIYTKKYKQNIFFKFLKEKQAAYVIQTGAAEFTGKGGRVPKVNKGSYLKERTSYFGFYVNIYSL
jgi:hypothetical protein